MFKSFEHTTPQNFELHTFCGNVQIFQFKSRGDQNFDITPLMIQKRKRPSKNILLVASQIK